MALDKEDKQWIIDSIYNPLHKEINEVGVGLHKEIKETEFNLRKEIIANRNEFKSISKRLDELSEELYRLNGKRQDDDEAAFSDIQKYASEVRRLKARVLKLEKKLA